MSYIEVTLKSELVAAFENAGHVCWKYPDLARGLKKPCDLIAGIQGRLVAIETKLRKVGTAANSGRWNHEMIVVKYEDVRTGQHTALKETIRRGSVAMILASIYDRHDYLRLAYAIPYEQFLTRAVWTYGDCFREAIPITWHPGKGWDVEKLVQWVTAGECRLA